MTARLIRLSLLTESLSVFNDLKFDKDSLLFHGIVKPELQLAASVKTLSSLGSLIVL